MHVSIVSFVSLRSDTDKTDNTDKANFQPPKNNITMAHITTHAGIERMTGAVSKRKKQGVHETMITRVKGIKDPLTGEIVDFGPNEAYLKRRRNMKENPLTEKEKKQRSKWSIACKAALEIIRDPSHPRYMELYHRWRAQLSAPKHCKEFPNFVRSVLLAEGGA